VKHSQEEISCGVWKKIENVYVLSSHLFFVKADSIAQEIKGTYLDLTHTSLDSILKTTSTYINHKSTHSTIAKYHNNDSISITLYTSITRSDPSHSIKECERARGETEIKYGTSSPSLDGGADGEQRRRDRSDYNGRSVRC
jgi:hypothetical protein